MMVPWFPWLPQSYGATLAIGAGLAVLLLSLLFLFLAAIACDHVPALVIGPGSHVIITGGSSGNVISFILLYSRVQLRCHWVLTDVENQRIVVHIVCQSPSPPFCLCIY
jgi:hypothetical protein